MTEFCVYPLTQPPPDFVHEVVSVFRRHEKDVGTTSDRKGMTSDQVLSHLRPDLTEIGFMIEAGKREEQKIKRPVFFGLNGVHDLQYEFDGWHPEWKCGIEVEAGRAWMGNAVYRDLVQAMVLVDLEMLILAVPLQYRYSSGGKAAANKDFEKANALLRALYGHSRINIPYSTCLIGY